MADPKLFKGFSLPVKTKIEESQFSELKRIVQNVVEAISRSDKELKFVLTNVDSSNVTRLNTNITNIQSEDGETVIDGPLLKMYDDSDTLRLELGFDEDTEDFIFSLKDNAGNEAIGIDSNGDAVFKGTVLIGDDYPVEIEDNFGAGIIRFYTSTTLEGWLAYLNGTNTLTMFTLNDVNIQLLSTGGDVQIISSTGEIMLQPNTDLDLQIGGDILINGNTGWSGSWVNNEGKTVTVTKGLITDVS